MEISQEIADGVSKSAQALQAAEAGVRQIGSMAQQTTVCMYYVFADIPFIFLLYFSHFYSPYLWLVLTAAISRSSTYLHKHEQRNKKKWVG